MNTNKRKLLEPKADNLFKSNKDLSEVHLCSNGQGFTDKSAAKRYAAKLKDTNVYTFIQKERAEAKQKEKEDKDNNDTGKEEKGNDDTGNEEKEVGAKVVELGKEQKSK